MNTEHNEYFHVRCDFVITMFDSNYLADTGCQLKGDFQCIVVIRWSWVLSNFGSPLPRTGHLVILYGPEFAKL